jgi:hypothetical protein
MSEFNVGLMLGGFIGGIVGALTMMFFIFRAMAAAEFRK